MKGTDDNVNHKNDMLENYLAGVFFISYIDIGIRIIMSCAK